MLSREQVLQLPAIFFNNQAKPTTETNRQADLLLKAACEAGLTGKRMTRQKRRAFCNLMHGGKIAWWKQIALAYSRNLASRDCTEANLLAVRAAVELGYFEDYRSPRKAPVAGQPKQPMSRLMPTEKLGELASTDPWDFDPDDGKPVVILHDRQTKRELPVDWKHPTVQKYQLRLERVNQINGGELIACVRKDFWTAEMSDRRLRPVHYAVFSDNYEKHGRIYTGRYGHQGLTKEERTTIRFNDEPAAELDYSGFHPRLLYHLEGIDYQGDPYALWGDKTTKPMRHMAKVFVNALINAEDATAAVSAANLSMNVRTKEGEWKQGKAYADAMRLLQAAHSTKIKFKEMLPIALKYHARIGHLLHRDMGVTLMNKDGELALAILYYFAKRGTPCLGCHDSFLVPFYCENELKAVMRRLYERRFGFLPKIRKNRNAGGPA